MSDDRRVHADVPGQEAVVRYNRQGKWYIEIEGARRHVRVADAVARALQLRDMGGVIHLGVPGGSQFDWLVERWTRGRAT